MTPGLRPSGRSLLRWCHLMLAGASRLVPARVRSDWRREWEAELWHRVLRLEERGLLTLGARLDLLGRCLGAYQHAAWLLGREIARLPALLELRAAVRDLGSTPRVTLTTVVSQALLIGLGGLACAAAAEVLFPIAPYSEAGRLVQVWNTAPDADLSRAGVSAAELAAFRRESRTLDELAAIRAVLVALSLGDRDEAVSGARVSPEFFALLRSPPTLGPGFSPDDFAPDAVPAVILGDQLWRRRFFADPNVVGQRVSLDGVSHRIAGVAASLSLPRSSIQLWLPLRPFQFSPDLSSRQLRAIGRLRPGATRAEAAAELSGISRRLQTRHPESFLGPFGVTWSVAVDPLGRPPWLPVSLLYLLLGAVGITLIAGTVAAANLTAMRLRFTSSAPCRNRWLQAVASVSLSAALAGGLVAACLPLVAPRLGVWLDHERGLSFGAPAIVFVAVASLLALGSTLAASWWTPRQPRQRQRGEAGLVAASVGCAALLLAGAGGYLASCRQLRAEGPGFNPAGLYALAADRPDGAEQDRRRIASIRGVEAVELASESPTLRSSQVTFEPERFLGPVPGLPLVTDLRVVGPDYFAVIGTALVQGRSFSRANGPGGAGEVIVNRALADRFWPAGDAVGQRLHVALGPGRISELLTIVGVAGNVRRNGLDRPAPSEVYVPPAVEPGRASILVIRSSLPADALLAAIEARGVGRRGAGRPGLVDVAEWSAAAMAPRRTVAIALGVLAALAAVVAAVSCYLLSAAAETVEGGASFLYRPVAAGAILGAAVGAGAFWALAPALAGPIYPVDGRSPGLIVTAVVLAGGLSLLAAALPRRIATAPPH